jgi:hypothetical protein
MHNHDRIYIPYVQARPLIKECDLLLYRGDAWYSWFIKKITRGEYSHVGLASWHNGDQGLLETIEFHGYRGGGATIQMSNLFPKFTKQIDVYRPAHIREDSKYYPETNDVRTKDVHLCPKSVTRTMRGLTGLPYGWRRLWWFFKTYALFSRYFYNMEDLTSDEIKDIIYPVCSTAIAYCFAKNNFDLLHEKSDEWTQPCDIAQSPLTNYLFTLV